MTCEEYDSTFGQRPVASEELDSTFGQRPVASEELDRTMGQRSVDMRGIRQYSLTEASDM